jgi:hypothetical protein
MATAARRSASLPAARRAMAASRVTIAEGSMRAGMLP